MSWDPVATCGRIGGPSSNGGKWHHVANSYVMGIWGIKCFSKHAEVGTNCPTHNPMSCARQLATWPGIGEELFLVSVRTCPVTFQSTKCTGGPHAHIAARSGSNLARDVTSPLPPLHGEASLMVWGSVCTRAQRSHQQWVNYITSHEISWAVWVSCLLTTSAINTWHGTRRLFAMRLNVEAATGRISNSSSEALSKKAIAQTGWDLWGFGATPLFQTNLLSRLRTRKSCVAGPSGETWIIMVHHHVYMLMRMLMFIYIYILLFWHGETGTETTSGWWKRRIAAATRHAISGGGGQIFMDPTPKSCAIAHTNAAEAKACVCMYISR